METFAERSLGLELEQAGERIRVARVKMDSAAGERGLPPLIYLESVNGERVVRRPVSEVQGLVRSASRPVTLCFDRGEAYDGLSAPAAVEKAARANGLATSRITISKADVAADGAPMCGFVSREGDFIEVSYTARLEANGRVFDSSADRGRPFAALLGNGDLVRGLELGLLEMCPGEERTILVPPALGFGARGSRTFGVPPDATLIYETKLISINGATDATSRREDVEGERRY